MKYRRLYTTSLDWRLDLGMEEQQWQRWHIPPILCPLLWQHIIHHCPSFLLHDVTTMMCSHSYLSPSPMQQWQGWCTLTHLSSLTQWQWHILILVLQCNNNKGSVTVNLAWIGMSVDLVRSKVQVTQGFWWWGLAQGLLDKGQGFEVKS